MSDTEVAEVLVERGKRYGDFSDHSRVTQAIKKVINDELARRGKRGAHEVDEALDMIAHKLGRIACGDICYRDSWVDIAGYAMLVAERLNP